MRAAPAFATLLLLACSSGGESKPPEPARPAPPRVVVTRVSVQDSTPEDRRPVQVPGDALKSALEAALAAEGLERGEAPEDAWRISVRARYGYGVTRGEGLLATPDKGRVKAVLTIDAQIRAPGVSEALHAYIETDDEADFDGDAAKLRAALDARVGAAASKAAKAVAARARLLGEDTPTLVTRLEDADPLVRRAAAGRLAMLKARAAVPALAARVKQEEDRETLLRMVGALTEIGDDQAAAALIELADPRDRELLRAVVDALSVVGGERVGDFFEVLGTHDSADIRLMVEQAKARLKRKK